MGDGGFASGLWKNAQAIKLGQDGGIEVPVRADGRNGIVGGLDAVAKAESGQADESDAPRARRSRWSRLLHRR